MKVTLADTVITVEGWTRDLDSVGDYTLKIRKTPEEMKAEKDRLKSMYGELKRKVNPIRREQRSVLYREEQRQDVVYFLPGLWPRVKVLLEKKGIQYEIVDKRNPDIRPEPDYSVLNGVELRQNQDVALALLASSDCGIIATSTGFGKSFCLSMLCKMYPTLNIVVTTSSQSVVQTLYGYLCETCPGEVGVKYAGKDTTRGKRIVVVTLKSLSTIPPENVQLLLCDECHNVGDGQAGQDIMQFCFARRFGFSASPVRNDGSGLFMEALFGPTILEMGYEEAVEAGMVTPLKYHMLPIDWGPDLCKQPELSDVLFKRFAYWRNTARNKAIQRLVYDIKQVYEGQILIMVNTLEHAIRLHMLLPWFTVLYYGVTDMADLRKKFPADKYPGLDLSQYKTTAKQVEIGRAAFAKGTLRFIISTKILKQGVNAPHLQVLIRADADVSEVEGIQIPGRLARLCEGKDYAYLIDCADNFSQRSKKRSDSREALYQKQKWQPITREALIDELRQSQDSAE